MTTNESAPDPTAGERATVNQAMRRATALTADSEGGWETTAAVLAFEVRRLRKRMQRRHLPLDSFDVLPPRVSDPTLSNDYDD